MTGFVAGLWGLFGGFAVEGLELNVAWQHHRCWPWQAPVGDGKPANGPAAPLPEAGVWGYVVAELIRLLIGAGLAWAAAATGQVAGPLGALGVGAAAPTIIGQLARAIPITPGSSPSPVIGHDRHRPSHMVHARSSAESDPVMPVLEGEK
jgi:hypothetical protein